jgi:hypothetical protein
MPKERPAGGDLLVAAHITARTRLYEYGQLLENSVHRFEAPQLEGLARIAVASVKNARLAAGASGRDFCTCRGSIGGALSANGLAGRAAASFNRWERSVSGYL